MPFPSALRAATFALTLAGPLSLQAFAAEPVEPIPDSPAASEPAPAAVETTPAAEAPVVAKPADSNLTVASVRMENGVRISQMIGRHVYNEQDQTIGTINDLMMTRDNRVAVAVISVGGFLGMGSKLVAVPWRQINLGQDGKIILPGASKVSLSNLPSFVFN